MTVKLGILVFVCCSVFLALIGKPIDAAGVGIPTSFPVSFCLPSPSISFLSFPPYMGTESKRSQQRRTLFTTVAEKAKIRCHIKFPVMRYLLVIISVVLQVT